jgi:hypothetical protein
MVLVAILIIRTPYGFAVVTVWIIPKPPSKHRWGLFPLCGNTILCGHTTKCFRPKVTDTSEHGNSSSVNVKSSKVSCPILGFALSVAIE